MALMVGSIQIRVLFFGVLKEIVGRAEESLRLEEGSSIGSVFERYEKQFPALLQHSSSILFSRNRQFAERCDALQTGDELAFLPPVSGGGSDVAEHASAMIFRLTHSVIDTRALAQELLRGFDGALLVFEGVVRDHSGERKTLYLEYEAYEPMALEKMREIGNEIRSKFQVDSIAMVHRLGRLEIGETSVVIAVTSEHRGPAFEACRYGIDRLKQIVPIWKKEFFAGGAVWVEGER